MIDGTEGNETTETKTEPANATTTTEVIRETGRPAGPVESAVEKASREARERISAGKPLDPTPVETEDKGKPQQGRKAGKFTTEKIPKPGDGTVGDSTKRATRAAAAAEETVEGEPEAGQATVEDDPEAGKGKPAKAGAEAAEGDEEEVLEGEEIDEAEETKKLTVQLPNRRDGGPALDVVMPDEETANSLRMVLNSFERGQALDQRQQQVNRMATDYEELKEIMTFDPAGFAVDSFSQDPVTAEHVALALLSQPEVWKRVSERVLQWEDPNKFETDATKIENANLRRKGELREMIDEQRTVQKNLREVQTAVASVIPPDMDEDRQAVFFRDALRDLKEYAERNGRMTLDIADIPLILASSGRLKAHGIDPKDAATRIVEARYNRQSGGSNGTQRPATSATAPAKKPAVVPQKTGKEMVERSKAKRAAASSPTGAGSPSSAVTPPPNQTIEERLKWHRDRQKKGALMTRGS